MLMRFCWVRGYFFFFMNIYSEHCAEKQCGVYVRDAIEESHTTFNPFRNASIKHTSRKRSRARANILMSNRIQSIIRICMFIYINFEIVTQKNQMKLYLFYSE